MQDYPKSACLYHPSESITNFCKEKTCLMPLCPTCICTHMDRHITEGKRNPKFDNINESLSTVSNQIRRFNDNFDEARNQLINVQRMIEDQKKTVSDLIYTVKVEVREMVESSFNDLQKELFASIDKQNQTMGLHVPKTLEQLQSGIFDVSGKLREMAKQLKTQKGLSALITFNHETRANVEKYQSALFKELKDNQEYSPIANVNYAAINRVKQSLAQVITLKFAFPQDLKALTKTSTEGSEVVPASTQAPQKLNLNGASISAGNVHPIYSPKVTGTKIPFSKTCMNSLRSSFEKGRPEILTSSKRPGGPIKTVSPTMTPINPKKVVEPPVVPSMQAKRGDCGMRKVEMQNRY